MPPTLESTVPGRSCPAAYRYGPRALARADETVADVLYVAGGLYGNRPALKALLGMIVAERQPVRLCFNGDFNWFNADAESFAAITRAVLAHDACLGNVEAELCATDDTQGCGCAYPADVDDETVANSNAIHARLKQAARHHPELLARLAALPMLRRYRIGDHRVGVVHGDAESLAGWRFDGAALDDPASRPWLEQAFRLAEVEVFASSHTCLPALKRIANAGVVINNGAAGMPNFRGRRWGVVTRIGIVRGPHEALYCQRLDGLCVEALALPYDTAAWEREFLALWPPGSPAHRNYHHRITAGPDYRIETAAPRFREAA